jgi:hypothetical protein
VSPSSAKTTELASGAIIGADELSVQLIQPDGMPAVVRINWPLRPTTAAAAHYPAVARRLSRSSPRVQPRWHDIRREDYEQRHQSARAVRGRAPRSRRVRAVGVVGGAQLMSARNIPPG